MFFTVQNNRTTKQHNNRTTKRQINVSSIIWTTSKLQRPWQAPVSGPNQPISSGHGKRAKKKMVRKPCEVYTTHRKSCRLDYIQSISRAYSLFIMAPSTLLRVLGDAEKWQLHSSVQQRPGQGQGKESDADKRSNKHAVKGFELPRVTWRLRSRRGRKKISKVLQSICTIFHENVHHWQRESIPLHRVHFKRLLLVHFTKSFNARWHDVFALPAQNWFNWYPFNSSCNSVITSKSNHVPMSP